MEVDVVAKPVLVYVFVPHLKHIPNPAHHKNVHGTWHTRMVAGQAMHGLLAHPLPAAYDWTWH
jgi:hypothetical protein